MIEFLESLSRHPGVEYVLLISPDGVPIAHATGTTETARDESLAALTAGWLNDLTHAIAPLGWHPPERICLRAARGTLVLRRTRYASLVVCLGKEASPEDVRLAMDGTLARIERSRTGRPSHSPAHEAREHASSTEPEPPGPIPSRREHPSVEEGVPPASHPGHVPGD